MTPETKCTLEKLPEWKRVCVDATKAPWEAGACTDGEARPIHNCVLERWQGN